VSVWLGLGASLSSSFSWADDSPVAGAEKASSVIFDCAGRTSDGTNLPSFASGGEAKFEVSATFGEGAIVALADAESSAILKPLYDAETTIGHLGFSDGEEATIVWTRMSGADGALMGEAITATCSRSRSTRRSKGRRSARSLCLPQPQQASSAEPAPWPRPASLSTAAAGEAPWRRFTRERQTTAPPGNGPASRCGPAVHRIGWALIKNPRSSRKGRFDCCLSAMIPYL